MPETRRCQQCGTAVPSGAPAGLCPRCLLLGGIDSQLEVDPRLAATGPSSPVGKPAFIPPTVEELAGAFPQLEILELLGKGGMGAVYKARQRGLDRFVAVKILPPEIGRNPAFSERFTREARALARLSHNHIVSVYDFGQTGKLFYIVMEHVDGVNLRKMMKSGGLSSADVLAIVPKICEALQYAHDEGVVHRDIKPENILLDKKGRLKIADFGLAKLLGRGIDETLHADTSAVGATEGIENLTSAGQVMGTPNYMAPEQMAQPLAVDHRADIYSLGVVFYEMLTGELPGGSFVPPSQKVEIDSRLDEVVLRSLEYEPERRYQRASQVKTDVETISRSTVMEVKATSRSVAVLPFVNMTGDPNAAYFCEGITDQLINCLSQLRRADLTVRPFSAVAAYQGQTVDTRAVGRDLNADVVVTGRIYPQADELSISVAIVDAVEGSQFWGNQYRGTRNDILILQDQIAKDVAASLRLELTSEEEKRLTRRHTDDVDAYLLYREGMHHWNKFIEERTLTAIEYFERALEKDPRYAVAYTGLAQCYAHLGNMYLPPKEAYPKAKDALVKALTLDDTIVELHVMLAYVALSYDWDWPEAERHLERAARLDPKYPAVHGVRAGYLEAMGRLQEAIDARKRAKELEPTAFRGLGLAGAYFRAGRYDDAISEARQTLARAEGFFLARGVLGLALTEQGNHDEAIAELQKARTHAKDHPQILGYHGYACARAGRIDDACHTLDELTRLPHQLPGRAFHIAVIHAGLGNIDEAFRWLRTSRDDRYVTMIGLRTDQLFKTLRGDVRFGELLRDMRL